MHAEEEIQQRARDEYARLKKEEPDINETRQGLRDEYERKMAELEKEYQPRMDGAGDNPDQAVGTGTTVAAFGALGW